jgi:hypothetical protein
MAMKTLLLIAALGAGALAATPALAGGKSDPRAVLELFTSQGCSSCPPADALLKTLAQRPDIVTLAYHVDYWDYIGWTDTFGAKSNSDHQRDYAAAWNSNRIFTPELVVNGMDGLVGSRQPQVDDAIAKAGLVLPVGLARDDHDMLSVDIAGNPGLKEASVWLITYLRDASVKMDRGENSGKTVDYTHVVTGRQVIGMWDPNAGAHLKLPLDEVLRKGSNGAAILVQEDKQGLPGRVLGAATYER